MTAESTYVDKIDDLSPLTDISDSDVEIDDILNQSTSRPAVFSINTGFDPLCSQNRKVNFRNKDDHERYKDTEQERYYAENGETVTTLLDLSAKVRFSYNTISLWSDYH